MVLGSQPVDPGPPSPRRGRSHPRLQTEASAAARGARCGRWRRWEHCHQSAVMKLRDRDARTAVEPPAAPPPRDGCCRSEQRHWNLMRMKAETLKGFFLTHCAKISNHSTTIHLLWNTSISLLTNWTFISADTHMLTVDFKPLDHLVFLPFCDKLLYLRLIAINRVDNYN